MAIAPLTFHRVLTLPATGVPGGFYVAQVAADRMKIAVAGEDGVLRVIAPPKLQAAFGLKGLPAAGRELGRYRVSETIDWDALASGASSDTPATAQSDVLVMRGIDLVARFRWAAGSSTASVSIIMPTSAPGDVLIFTAPAVQDATLTGIAGTFTGLRRT